MGALATVFIIWGLIIALLIEAVKRFFHRPVVDGKIMLIIACIGLACNFINMFILDGCAADATENAKVKEEGSA